VQQRFDSQHVWNKKRLLPQDAQKGRPARPQAYPLGHGEGLNDARTKLADFFSILLVVRIIEHG